MSTVTQFAKTIARAGPEDELPGAPTNLSPLTYGPALDIGLMGFATDTGRIFIGHQPTVGDVNFERINLPYQNLEILTEASHDANRAVFGSMVREITPDMSYSASMGIAALGTWNTMSLDGGLAVPYVVASKTAAFDVHYAIAAVGVPIRVGTLNVIHDGVAANATLIDRWMNIGATAMTESNYVSSSATIQFRFRMNGPVGAEFLSFEYQNSTSDIVTINFRTRRLL